MSISVKLKNVTLAYPHLFEKHAPPGTTNERYSAEFILDPQRNAESCAEVDRAFREVVKQAGKEAHLQYLQSPLKSGDMVNEQALAKGRKMRPELAGMRLLRAGDANYAPSVVNAKVQPIGPDQRDQIFGGCIVNAYIDLYWSSNQANPGCFAGLRGVQLVDNVNVEPLYTGIKSAEEMFQPIAGAPEPLQPATEKGPSQEKMPWD